MDNSVSLTLTSVVVDPPHRPNASSSHDLISNLSSPPPPPPLTGDELLLRVSVSAHQPSLHRHYAPSRFLSTDPEIVGGWRGEGGETDTRERWNVWQIIFVRNSPCVKYPLQPATHALFACRRGSAPQFRSPPLARPPAAESSFSRISTKRSSRLRNGLQGSLPFHSFVWLPPNGTDAVNGRRFLGLCRRANGAEPTADGEQLVTLSRRQPVSHQQIPPMPLAVARRQAADSAARFLLLTFTHEAVKCSMNAV